MLPMRMLSQLYPWLRPSFFALDPERAHHLAMRALELSYRTSLLTVLEASHRTSSPIDLFGLRFPNRVGLGAGFDKDGEHIDALGALGFGFIEVGTVTPRPQPGNPTPRLFRLPGDEALINRMGFNNHGVAALVSRIQTRRFSGVVGVNIGKNKDTPLEDAASDYTHCLELVAPLADYVTVNISSPNTPGLRTLQEPEQLRRLLGSHGVGAAGPPSDPVDFKNGFHGAPPKFMFCGFIVPYFISWCYNSFLEEGRYAGSSFDRPDWGIRPVPGAEND